MPRRQDLGFHQKSAAPRSPFLVNFLENRGVSLPKAEDGLRHEALEKPNYGTSEWVVALSLVTVEGRWGHQVHWETAEVKGSDST